MATAADRQPENKAVAVSPVGRLKLALSSDSVQEQFKNALQDNAPLFVASLIDVYGADSKLQKCAPALVIQEALKAATLKLPINKNLGFAYILPYDKRKQVEGKWVKEAIPQFQMGYKGFIQLAMRTGQYRFINADAVYEGEKAISDRVSGEFRIEGEAKSETAIGYFAFFETINGFSKALYWTTEHVTAHAKKYSQSFKYEGTNWHTNFEAMALKTVLKNLLSKYGILSVEMVSAISGEPEDSEAKVQQEIDDNANQGEIIDIEPEPAPEETKAPVNGTAKETAQTQAEPGF